jgi:hypothetical protein
MLYSSQSNTTGATSGAGTAYPSETWHDLVYHYRYVYVTEDHGYALLVIIKTSPVLVHHLSPDF